MKYLLCEYVIYKIGVHLITGNCSPWIIPTSLLVSVQRSSYALTPRAATLPVSGTFGGYVSTRM